MSGGVPGARAYRWWDPRQLPATHVAASFLAALVVGLAASSLLRDVGTSVTHNDHAPRPVTSAHGADGAPLFGTQVPPPPPSSRAFQATIGQLTLRPLTLTDDAAHNRDLARRYASMIHRGALSGVVVAHASAHRSGEDPSRLARQLAPIVALEHRRDVAPPLVIFAMEGRESAAWCDNIVTDSYQDLTDALSAGTNSGATRRAAAALGQRLAAAGATTLMATSFKDGPTFGCLSRLHAHTQALRTDSRQVVTGLRPVPGGSGVDLLALGADPRPGKRFNRYINAFTGRPAFVALANRAIEESDPGRLVRKLRARLPHVLVASVTGRRSRVDAALAAGVDLVLFQSASVDVTAYFEQHPAQAQASCRRVVRYKRSLNPRWSGHAACDA